MSLIGVFGRSEAVNRHVMELAIEKAPALIVDAASIADPHSLMDAFDDSRFENVFVVPAESLYRFRGTVKLLPKMLRRVGARLVVITTFHGLFNYDDEEENADAYSYCWEFLREVGYYYDVVVGVDASQSEVARKFCDEVRLHGPYCFEFAHR